MCCEGGIAVRVHVWELQRCELACGVILPLVAACQFSGDIEVQLQLPVNEVCEKVKVKKERKTKE